MLIIWGRNSGEWDAKVIEREGQMFSFQHQCFWSQEYIADPGMIKCAGISSNAESADSFKEENNNFKIIKWGCKYNFLIWDSSYLYHKMNSHIKILLFLIRTSFKPRDCLDFMRLSEENVVFSCDRLTWILFKSQSDMNQDAINYIKNNRNLHRTAVIWQYCSPSKSYGNDFFCFSFEPLYKFVIVVRIKYFTSNTEWAIHCLNNVTFYRFGCLIDTI